MRERTFLIKISGDNLKEINAKFIASKEVDDLRKYQIDSLTHDIKEEEMKNQELKIKIYNLKKEVFIF